jgi:hypothetical protein
MTEQWPATFPARTLAARLLALLLALIASPAAAHLTPNSEIRLHFEPSAVSADVLIPAGEYGYATGLPIDGGAESLAAAGRYLLSHASIRAPDGRDWAEELSKVAIVPAAGGPDLTATIRFHAPPNAPDRRFTFALDAVIASAPDHFALLAVAGDLAAGQAEENDLLGTFVASRTAIPIDRGVSSGGGLFLGAVRLGARHILAGHDHLLFLLALLLPAPLLAVRGRWGEPRDSAASVRDLAWIVTAFTIGHSLTLIAAALFGLSLPAPPVEAGIALSVLISAIHAWRPLFPGREPLVAAGFGLVHGLAFATVVTGFGAAAATRAIAILGFNLGIEVVQLGIVATLLPALLLGARTRFYQPARRLLAAVAGLAALAWLGERLSGQPNAVAAAFATLLPPAALVLVALSLVIGLGWLVRRSGLRLPVAAVTGPA